MNNRVLIPGTYDPPTYGHISLFNIASEHFDELYVGIFINPDKSPMFTLDSRIEALKHVTKDLPNVYVFYDEGFVSDYAKSHNIPFILKGFRNNIDYEYEKKQAIFNKERTGVDTILIPAKNELVNISSTNVRNNFSNTEILKDLIPIDIKNILKQK